MSKRIIKKKQKSKNKIIVNEHISELFKIAKENNNSENIELSRNSIKLATKYSSRYKVTIPRELKRSFCKKCFSLLVAGKTCTVRIKPGKKPLRIITCTNCKTVKRIGFEKGK